MHGNRLSLPNFQGPCRLRLLDYYQQSIAPQPKGIFATFTLFDAEVFFGVLEEIVVRRSPGALLSVVYKILMCIYEEDIAEADDNVL